MDITSASKLPEQKHIALVFAADTQPAPGIFSDAEMAYLEKMRKTHTEQWLEVNQYSRRVFVYFIGEDKPPHIRLEKMRKAGAALAVKLNALKETEISVAGADFTLEVGEGLALGNYQFLRYLSKADKKNTLTAIHLLGVKKKQVEELKTLVGAVCFARDLINTPVWDLNAQQLGESAAEAGKKHGFHVDVLSKKKIETLKMGGLLAVNKGSIDPPAFIIMEYKPEKPRNKKPVVLVGKGVVYDTGGLSLKPTPNSMDEMKCDMSGAAAVIATLSAVAEAKLPVHVVGLVPATDNRPGGNAVTPGDVITISDGTTIEVMNTDAEGRLILADALHYAKKFKPELVIDLATLTGSAARAIGRYGIVAMGTAGDEAWQKLDESGDNTYERLVQFPFWDEYKELLKSPIADMKNIGGADAGAITAGLFLAHFTDYPYIHLDIAGPSFLNAEDGYLTKGGTGVGVRLLFDFLKNY